MVQGINSSNVNDLTTSLKQGSSSEQVQNPGADTVRKKKQVKVAKSAGSGDTVTISSDYMALPRLPLSDVKPPSRPVTFDEKNALYKAYAALSQSVTTLFNGLSA